MNPNFTNHLTTGVAGINLSWAWMPTFDQVSIAVAFMVQLLSAVWVATRLWDWWFPRDAKEDTNEH